jgi:hypothetical protein
MIENSIVILFAIIWLSSTQDLCTAITAITSPSLKGPITPLRSPTLAPLSFWAFS